MRPFTAREMASKDQRRRAVVAVQVAVMMTAIIGFAALTVDVGVMYNAKADLQRTADAAALAAASRLVAFDDGEPTQLARAEALDYTARNNVFGKNVTLDGNDVEFGRAVYNEGSGSYDFVPTEVFPDAVRVRVRLEEGSANGALSLYFARVFGKDSAEMSAEAIAMMVPRDIAVVADLSGSHTDDSEFRNYKDTDINLFDVWDDFPGGIDDEVSSWDGNEFPLDGDGWSEQMAGPAWGYMKQLGYGTRDIDASYSPSSDPGLVRLPQYQDWNDSSLRSALLGQGYSTQEVNAIMSDQYDSNGAWEERVAVALGLARWNSGIPGGLWEQLGMPAYQAGNGNTWVGGSELTWVESFGNRSLSQSDDIWLDYIGNYMSKTWSEMYRANSDLRYRFGVKTFTNYLMERRTTHYQTPEFAGARTQPMQAVKDAVGHMCDTIEGLDTDDRLSLEIYGETARHEVNLTDDYQSIAGHLNAMQAGHYDTWTNMGGGILRGIEELTGSRARPTARKVMILLTDGMANVTATGKTGDYYNGRLYAKEMAQAAVDQGIRIFSVSVGSGADTALMSEIATMGSGDHFHAEGSIEAYSAQLEVIFKKLGGSRPVELIR